MGVRIYHHPRVAWDFAQVVVSVARAGDDVYEWFGTRVGQLLGPSYRGKLNETRSRLSYSKRDDAPYLEVGLWRARVDDVLSCDFELAEDLYLLTRATASRLARPTAPPLPTA
jgi:hypothetical protein